MGKSSRPGARSAEARGGLGPEPVERAREPLPADAGSDAGEGTDAGDGADAGSDAGAADAGGVCAVDCDCPQGERCIGGACRIAARPFYCCDTAGCPAGQLCTDASGAAGRCPDTTTDCAMAGGECVVQFTPCPAGFGEDSTVSCGPVRSLRCCLRE